MARYTTLKISTAQDAKARTTAAATTSVQTVKQTGQSSTSTAGAATGSLKGTLSADAYFFLNAAKQYVSVGGKATKEDANDNTLDYDAGYGRARFVLRFGAFDREMTLRAGVEYEKRDYKAPLPGLSVAREDKRTGIDVSIEAPINETFFVEGSYRYGDYQSNLTTANYSEQVVSVKLGVKY